VSELSFGNFIYGSHMWGKTPADAPEGVRLQNLAFDLGVNFYDTGDAYSNGHAERLMADTLKYAGRDKIVLSTKFGYDFYTDPGTQGSAGQEFLAAMEKLVKAGKVRAWGIALGPAIGWREEGVIALEKWKNCR